MGRHTRRLLAAGLGAGVIFAAATALPAAAEDPADFDERVSAAAIMEHLQALQDIADANGGTRAIGTPGYEASAAYIESVLASAGYETERQPFVANTQTIDQGTYVFEVTGADVPDGVPMEFTPGTPSGAIVDVAAVAPATATGCDATEWGGVDATGLVAVVSRGVCPFSAKSLAAAEAGAVAVVIYDNDPAAESLNGTLGGPTPGTVPSIGVTLAEGQALVAALDDVTFTITIDEETTSVDTFNVLAQSPGVDETGGVVMIGAHLDSVPEGPGINDNGSGSAAILETAVQLAASGTPQHPVRFAWWGAEEVGLVGSTYYTSSLTDEEIAEISAYLNFDMVGSPNYVIATYDADESTFPADDVEVPEGSAELEAIFTDWFDSVGQPHIDTPFDGRSDYQGFIDAGIPSSGLFTGAEDIKTAEEAALFGGTAGAAYDPNYHQPGDTIENVSVEAIGINAAAIAHAVDVLAIVPDPAPAPVVPVPSPSDPGSASGAQPALAATGSDPAPAVLAGGALVLGGLVLALALGRRRTTARP
ncbi:putative lipoprotein aminopeptidase LpqL [Cnuibacter physcomitrellae]|nr:M20/M25/M40 family metallo-hydrolase [Cnuibacter physcomitrellae]GGI36208.1 putative lipoprotein aminopeptidase LpqL [Cnuibacter physcomitrellae]